MRSNSCQADVDSQVLTLKALEEQLERLLMVAS